MTGERSAGTEVKIYYANKNGEFVNRQFRKQNGLLRYKQRG